MNKFPFSSRATLTAVACAGIFVTFLADPSIAETPLHIPQKQKDQQAKSSSTAAPASEPSVAATTTTDSAVAAPTRGYVATAYTLRGRTASGRYVSKGLIAADRRVLPLGSRVRLDAGAYSGEYTVADTGALVRGHKIDIWMPSNREARLFGRRLVKLTVLNYGQRLPRQKAKSHLAKR